MTIDFNKYKNIDLPYTLKTLWSFVKRYKTYLYFLIIAIILLEGFGFLDTFVFKYLIDRGAEYSANEITGELFKKLILYAVLVFLGLKLIDGLLWFARIHFLNKLESKVLNDIEKKSFWHILGLSYRFHLNKKTGSIISQFTRGVSKSESLIDVFFFNFIPVTFRLLFSIGIIFYFDLATAITLLIMSVLFIIFGVYIANLQKIPQNISNYREDVLKQNLSDVFLNIETVKYFSKEKRTSDYFNSLSKKLKNSRYYYWGFHRWHAMIQTFILGIGIGTIFYLSFTNFMVGKLTLGTITLIYSAIWRLLPQLFGLIHGYRDFIRNSVDVSALFEMFKEENEVVDIEKAKNLKIENAEIVYDDVSFRYPKKKKEVEMPSVLKDFNLKIEPDSKVAFVGPSGSGKTTVVKLLYRLFDIDEGKILIDGQDISEVTQNSLRNSMSIVPQEPILFDNTIYFNIAYANPKASKQEVWKAIRFAQLDKFINSLPLKEKTIVGERGVKLSGGEKQRVSIARAILADKKILVLDEATSALDSETEREIQSSLEKLMRNRTTIIIAHRLSTIMKADKIVVLSKGRILEIGSHDELKNRHGGLYRRLWNLQQGGRL